MRENCPVCGSKPIDHYDMEYAVPDGWTLPSKYRWQLCKCGFIWANTDKKVEDFDEYYRKHYAPTFDQNDIDRINSFCDFIIKIIKPTTRVVDFGGGGNTLVDRLRSKGFDKLSVVNLDDEMLDCDLVVLSQVIEHLYDLDRDFDKIDKHLGNQSVVIIETPDAAAYAFRNSPPMLDYYPTHVNHFAATSLISFMASRGYALYLLQAGIEYQPTNAPMFRTIFVKGAGEHIFGEVKNKLSSIKPIETDGKVIIYGLGDLAMHQIVHSKLDVAYYVDEAEVYKNASINGIPIKSKLGDDNYPVLVIGNRCKDEILSKLSGRRIIET